jgi:hypothetical protein
MELKKINNAVAGALNLEVEFDDEEHAFLIEFAINHLLAAGSYPFTDEDTKQVAANSTLN